MTDDNKGNFTRVPARPLTPQETKTITPKPPIIPIQPKQGGGNSDNNDGSQGGDNSSNQGADKKE
ncbi:MAG: hypothetical protein QG574_5417 [Cyanobacteriota bacterium erpe_2018_sw_21hr_WHONDRS-SW48-000092_B_bin.40]|nr:hypothetical protein [Cyanobacteriota bacterium erpe_2018_sw_21hr_WHONDRS-SW48-000092_B_bin.40]